MGKRLFSLLFSPSGRINRSTFLLGIVLLAVFFFASGFILPNLSPGIMGTIGLLLVLFLCFHFILCVYGKRLHDLGRGLWPLVGMIVLTLLVFIIVALKFGGLDYFNTVLAHPEYADDDEKMREVLDRYNAQLEANSPFLSFGLFAVPAIFTAWLALAKGQAADNRYGSHKG